MFSSCGIQWKPITGAVPELCPERAASGEEREWKRAPGHDHAGISGMKDRLPRKHGREDRKRMGSTHCSEGL